MEQVAVRSRREMNKARTRAAIMKAARGSFAAVGVAGATMDQIADAAEVSRATLFNYFSSKADIVAALVEQLDADFLQLIEHYRTQPLSTAERIVGIFTDSGNSLEKRRDTLRPLVMISEQSWAERHGIVRLARLTDAFERLLVEVTDVRRDADARLLAEILVSIYILSLIHI